MTVTAVAGKVSHEEGMLGLGAAAGIDEVCDGADKVGGEHGVTADHEEDAVYVSHWRRGEGRVVVLSFADVKTHGARRRRGWIGARVREKTDLIMVRAEVDADEAPAFLCE